MRETGDDAPEAPRTRPAHDAQRVPFWDNARWIAITLVVVGHGILPQIGEDDAAYSVYLIIYSFHMPVRHHQPATSRRPVRRTRGRSADPHRPRVPVLHLPDDLDRSSSGWSAAGSTSIHDRVVDPVVPARPRDLADRAAVPRAAALAAHLGDRDLDRRRLHRERRLGIRALAHHRHPAVLRVRLEGPAVAARRSLARAPTRRSSGGACRARSRSSRPCSRSCRSRSRPCAT